MGTAIVAVVAVGVCAALVIVVARDAGPSPADVALGYEQAWDRLDFETIWAMAGDELRDGLAREQFVAAKAAAYAAQAGLRSITAAVTVDAVRSTRSFAVVRTRIELRDHTTVHNDIQLTRRGDRWLVTGYALVPDPAAG